MASRLKLENKPSVSNIVRKDTGQSEESALLETDLPAKLFKRGKVRDTYDIGDDKLLMIATDRISAFDVVLQEGVPEKGRVLNKMSIFWFDHTKDIVKNHIISDDTAKAFDGAEKYAEVLKDRSVIVTKADPIPYEAVVRGYLAGSAWAEYKKSETVAGVKMPEGLQEGSKLPEIIFTPATKNDQGHDVNITFEELEKRLGKKMANELKEISTKLYKKASEHALEHGIIIADTKFEFGIAKSDTETGIKKGDLILIDELFTPDSSRFWPAKDYAPGRPQPSFDKQYVRDHLERLKWNKEPPAPHLSEEVIANTQQKYYEAYERLTGMEIK